MHKIVTTPNGNSVIVVIRRQRLTDHVTCKACGFVGHQFPIHKTKDRRCSACGSKLVKASAAKSVFREFPPLNPDVRRLAAMA
jgi:DNA-directed RNA polymerase subunit RPC12/RpoP